MYLFFLKEVKTTVVKTIEILMFWYLEYFKKIVFWLPQMKKYVFWLKKHQINFFEAYANMNSGMHDRFYKKMFQGPKGYIAQMCEVHLQYGNRTTKRRFYTFFESIPLYTLLYSLYLPILLG